MTAASESGRLAFFAENFQRTPGSPMVYPGNFPDDWQSGSQGAAALAEFAAAENVQAADPTALTDRVQEADFDRLEADGRTPLSRDVLVYASCILDFETLQAAAGNSSDSKDIADAVDFLIAKGYW